MKFYLLLFLIIGSLTTISLSALPAQIIIIRQAEKNSTNHTEKKNSNDELSLKGKERAAAFPLYIMETPELITFNTPAAIYASIPPKPASSQRSIDTVRPLADLLKLTIRDTFESNDYKRMVEEIKKDPTLTGKMVLICWEHTYIPEMARAFGAFQTPATWSSTAFDRTWIITFQPSGKAVFQNLPQRLMFGDSST
jgi:hypothetical protein